MFIIIKITFGPFVLEAVNHPIPHIFGPTSRLQDHPFQFRSFSRSYLHGMSFPWMKRANLVSVKEGIERSHPLLVYVLIGPQASSQRVKYKRDTAKRG